MCKRYYEINKAVSSALKKLNEDDYDLSLRGKETVNDIITTLKPIAEFLEFLSAKTLRF